MNPEYQVIRAVYDDATIRVYQAYNEQIAREAVVLNRFGKLFSMNRMTWIKPSFLWMMYRSGWATKSGQEHILAIDMNLAGFDRIVNGAVVSSFDRTAGADPAAWRTALRDSEVRVQWDPERDIYGRPLDYRSIQLGIRGQTLATFNEEWIVSIRDITAYVEEQRTLIATDKLDCLSLPVEKEYRVRRL